MKKNIYQVYINLFIYPVPYKILNLLSSPENSKWNLTKLCRKSYHSYSQIGKIILDFEENGIVKCEKIGRTKYITLTDKGKRFCNKLKIFKKTLQTLANDKK